MKSRLHILQCAPIDLAVSRRLKYAGTERIVEWLNRSYSELGHNSKVAAAGDSNLEGIGTLIPTVPNSLWTAKGNERKFLTKEERLAFYEAHYQTVLRLCTEGEIDILQDHPGNWIVSSKAYEKAKPALKTPIVTTVHEDVSEENRRIYETWKSLKSQGFPVFFTGISKHHVRKHERELGIQMDGFVYNGVPLEDLPFQEKKQDFLFWIGRISAIKGTDIAVQIAKKTNRPLIIAGEVHTPYRKFFEEEVLPYITRTVNSEEERKSLTEALKEGKEIVKDGEVLYIGPLDDGQKSVLYRNAYAVLMPNRWEEPFGLTMVEAMASGTPVIGSNRGSIPEIVSHGRTGYVLDTFWLPGTDKQVIDSDALSTDMAEAVARLHSISRISYNCREHIERNFERKKMAEGYVSLFEKLLKR